METYNSRLDIRYHSLAIHTPTPLPSLIPPACRLYIPTNHHSYPTAPSPPDRRPRDSHHPAAQQHNTRGLQAVFPFPAGMVGTDPVRRRIQRLRGNSTGPKSWRDSRRLLPGLFGNLGGGIGGRLLGSSDTLWRSGWE